MDAVACSDLERAKALQEQLNKAVEAFTAEGKKVYERFNKTILYKN